jgi:hypothetical protein
LGPGPVDGVDQELSRPDLLCFSIDRNDRHTLSIPHLCPRTRNWPNCTTLSRYGRTRAALVAEKAERFRANLNPARHPGRFSPISSNLLPPPACTAIRFAALQRDRLRTLIPWHVNELGFVSGCHKSHRGSRDCADRGSG